MHVGFSVLVLFIKEFFYLETRYVGPELLRGFLPRKISKNSIIVTLTETPVPHQKIKKLHMQHTST